MRGKSDTMCKASCQRRQVREREESKMGDLGEWPRCGGSSWCPEEDGWEEGIRVKTWRRNRRTESAGARDLAWYSGVTVEGG